ncbi:Fe-S cluster assembly protein IscX [Entomomonas asaccharolytica]|uniref:Fe-S cluster assembly protein IscX n=1 Tax=Entomomonas asaccharolytica TaxID=2785331 RepID=A0A974RXP4_9GAMM|nr:Fe-S cluster assembly protein IscX [Entomomonas asaccharolytica]QQP86390.1 Fe-S cluster assembly protein IscX [Entomomonas asaccharolytica]
MILKWTDVQEIAIQLTDTYPSVNPLTINFVELRQKVMDLPEFNDDPNRCGEKVLEAIQSAWIEELE